MLLDPQVSASGSLGVERRFGQAWKADAEAFYKDYRDLIVDNPDFRTLDDQFFTNEGIGRTYGLEMMVRRERVGNVFGWLSYTLSRSERRDHPGEDWYLFDFDQTHILVALAGYRLPYDFEVSGKAEYTTGNPTTPYALGIYDVDQVEGEFKWINCVGVIHHMPDPLKGLQALATLFREVIWIWLLPTPR